jgi:TonB family protein
MREKIQGDVMLEAIVGADGKVARVRVTKSLNAPSGLDQSAMDAAKAWLFKQGMLDGKPVPVIVQLVLNFSLH